MTSGMKVIGNKKSLAMLVVLVFLFSLLIASAGLVNAEQNAVVYVDVNGASEQYVSPSKGETLTVDFKVANINNVAGLALLMPIDNSLDPVNAAAPWNYHRFINADPAENIITGDNEASLLVFSLGATVSADETPKEIADISFTVKQGAPDGTININPVYNHQNPYFDMVQFTDNQSQYIPFTSNTAKIVIDGTPPVIAFSNDNPTEITDINVVNISGTISDANLAPASVKVNNVAAVVNELGGNNYSFSADVPLTLAGKNIITVTGADKAGNTASIEGEVYRHLTRPAPPVAYPGTGTYATGVNVTLCAPDSAIYYTTDGTEPGPDNGTLYTDRFTVMDTTTVKAIAIQGDQDSEVAEYTYSIVPDGVGDPSLEALAAEMVKINAKMDDNDRAALAALRANVHDLTREQWENLLGPMLAGLTPEAKAAFGCDQVTTLKYLLLDADCIMYSGLTDQAELEQHLKVYRSTWKNLFFDLFGNEFTVEELFNFLMAVQEALPNQFNQNDLERFINEGMGFISGEMQAWINAAITEVLDRPEFAKFNAKLVQIGLDRELLIETKNSIMDTVDPTYQADVAMVKAYLRSKATLSGEMDLFVGEMVTYGLSVNIGNNTYQLADMLKWSSTNPAVAEILGGSTLEAKAVGTTTVVAYKETGGVTDWLAKFDVTVTPSVAGPEIKTAAHDAGTGWLTEGKTFRVTVLSVTGNNAYYQVGSGNWVPMEEHQFIKGRYQGTYVVTNDSPNGSAVPVKAKVVGAYRNETVRELPTVKIDTVAPAAPGIAIDNVDLNAKTATITLSTADLDATSGTKQVELYRWSYRNAEWVLLETFSAGGDVEHDVALREGENKFATKAIDNANNVSESNELVYQLDTKPPVLSVGYAYNDETKVATVTVKSSKLLQADPEVTYVIVDNDTGAELAKDSISLTKLDDLLYTGTFTNIHSGQKLDITAKGTGVNGLQGMGIYTELPVSELLGVDMNYNDVVMLIPNGAYFAQNIPIGVSDDDGSAAADQDLDVLEARHFRPDGTQFVDDAGNPVYAAITFKYADGINVDQLVIFYYNPLTGDIEEWSEKVILADGETIPVQPEPYVMYIKTGTKTITVYTDHFSVYGVAVDNVPPVLNITAPVDGAVVKGSVNVAGQSEDGATITIKVDGVVATSFVLAGKQFDVPVNLTQNKENVITVTAEDAAKNKTTRTITVTEDSTKPSLSVTPPETPTTKTSIELLFSSDANIADEDYAVTVYVTADGKTDEVDTVFVGNINATNNYKATVPLVVGNNKISVNATDDRGTTSYGVTVVRQQAAGGGGGGGGGGGVPANRVGTGGGTAKSADGVVELTIPAGALSKNVDFTIKKVDLDKVTQPAATLKFAGDVYEFGPEGTQFAKPVKMTLKYDTSKLAGLDESLLKIYKLSNGSWVAVGGVVDKNNRTVTVEVESFSMYAVMIPVKPAEPKPPVNLTDLTGHWAKSSIEKLVGMGVVAGYPDNTFKPNNSITRAEFATLMVKAMNLNVVTPAQPTFTDVPSKLWSYGYVEAASKAGLVQGDAGKFRPEDKITRQEIATILVRAMGLESDAAAKGAVKLDFADAGNIAAWANGYVAVAVEQGLINGYPDNTFMPGNNATRAESATMVVRYLDKK